MDPAAIEDRPSADRGTVDRSQSWMAENVPRSEPAGARADVVAKNLAPFASFLSFHKGWIPDRFQDVADDRFAFVHVDVDLRQPTIDSVTFFHSRLSPGGILLCDDYGCSTCPGATQSINAFLADKPEKMISLDAGGGFFIKGKSTAAVGQIEY